MKLLHTFTIRELESRSYDRESLRLNVLLAYLNPTPEIIMTHYEHRTVTKTKKSDYWERKRGLTKKKCFISSLIQPKSQFLCSLVFLAKNI
jgi:hypothetical protein